MKTVQQIALEYSNMFKTKTRANGETFFVVDECQPLMNIIQKVNGEIFPDDYKYEFVYEALLNISEAHDIYEIQCEPNIYNNELLEWLSSHASRIEYVNETVEELGHSEDGLIGDISIGQWAEKNEVLTIVLSELETLVEKSEAA